MLNKCVRPDGILTVRQRFCCGCFIRSAYLTKTTAADINREDFVKKDWAECTNKSPDNYALHRKCKITENLKPVFIDFFAVCCYNDTIIICE